MSAFYNENDPKAAAWLRELIKQGHIAPGVVDERSIEDVKPGDLDGYQQVHMFAGIAGWSLALRLAGWPDDQPVWTGSCPCQPFSAAGKGTGFADERHLWPAWFHLIRERSPAVVFGEQVASAHRWLDLVHSDLEAVGYAVGAMPIEAASVGANHLRDRYWFVADTAGERGYRTTTATGSTRQSGIKVGSSLADAYKLGTREERQQRGGQFGWTRSNPDTCDRPVANSHSRGLSGQDLRKELPWGAQTEQRGEVCGDSGVVGFGKGRTHWVVGHDGKARRFEPSIRLLANGLPARVVRLRGYGNAIVPQVAAEFIGAYLETKQQELRRAA